MLKLYLIKFIETIFASLVSINRKVPSYRQRIAGKSVPLEKFASKKSERYFAQGESLVLPCLEAIYLHNGFLVIGKRKDLLESILDTVSQAQESLGEDLSLLYIQHLPTKKGGPVPYVMKSIFAKQF